MLKFLLQPAKISPVAGSSIYTKMRKPRAPEVRGFS